MSNLATFTKALKGNDFLVLDTETMGLEDGEVVQIAISDALDALSLLFFENYRGD